MFMQQFPISKIDSNATNICQLLCNAGHSAYIVGGCVRDLILDSKPKDWDIATSATPQEVIKLFPKTYPTGLQHGTVTVAMGEGKEKHFEVTTFRVEGEYKDGRRPEEVNFVQKIEQDLERRDLTINAMAYDPINNILIDPFNGINDLNNKIIRAVGAPEARFQEDGLRIMRVARFAARFGYGIDAPTFAGMQASLEILKKVSKERIQDELCKILVTNNPSYGIWLLWWSGAMAITCPLLVSNKEFIIPYLHKCQGDLETRLALLYSNYETLQVKEELISLKFSNNEIKKVIFLLQLLPLYHNLVQEKSATAYKRLLACIKNSSPDIWFHTLEQFIQLTEALGHASRAEIGKYQDEIVFSRKEMTINGDDLLGLGIPPGPQIKNILDKCYAEILDNPKHNTKEYLKRLIS